MAVMAQGSLKSKTISGVFWSAFQKFGTMAISFVANIVLARLLSPDDFGCIGMLAIFITLSGTFIDGGFGSALIQKKDPTDKDYSTIFYWNLLLSFFLYGILYFSAPAIARYYEVPLLSSVLRVEGLVLIINALSIIQNNRLRKQLRFKKLAIIDITSAIISIIITIILAYCGFGIWALVAQQLLMCSITTTLLWITGKWYPKAVFSTESFKELFNFGFFILLANLVNTFCNNIQGLLIGKIYNPSTMGYYSQGKKLEEVASTSISNVVDRVAYPILAEAQNDKPRLIRMLGQFITSLAYLTIPLMLLLILVAKPLIVLIYSSKWLPTVPYFQILCIAGIAISLQGLNYYAVAAVGKSGKLLIWTLIKRGIGLVFVVGGLAAFGMKGLLEGMVLTSYTIYFINAFMVHRHVGYRLMHQFSDLLPIMLVAIAAFLPSLALHRYLEFNMYTISCLQIVLFIGIYLGLSYLFKLSAFHNFVDIARNIIQKYFPKKQSEQVQ